MAPGDGMTRRDRLIRERNHDPYRAKEKLTEPTVCPECSAVFREGRWRWAAGPADAPRALCPACQRARDHYPAGFLQIQGDFLRAHRQEILQLCRHTADREGKDHPQNRILDIEPEGDGVLVTTATIHMARTLGDALRSAYQGELELDYEEDVLRARWSRA
jgi:NMD protein affecting ribosome stability and mRNA decay